MLESRDELSEDTDGRLDDGIRDAVNRLRAAGIDTFASCQGGDGHRSEEPMIRFRGDHHAGWYATEILNAAGYRVMQLARLWNFDTSGVLAWVAWDVVLDTTERR